MASGRDALGPFVLRASLHETIWGGQRLRELAGKLVPDGALVGESWETALDSIVITPPHEGRSLDEMVATYGTDLLGEQAMATYGHRFPLLAKFLDANQWLSVQVHPDDRYAAETEGGRLGKTEAWYILEAEPGAQIIYGVAEPATREVVRDAIAATQLEPLLRSVAVDAGDVVFVPAGTVHAIGAGVALYELQEYSDITYRLYDYGRLGADGQPRELHVARGLDVMNYDPSRRIKAVRVMAAAADGAASREILVACPYFVEEQVRVSGETKEGALSSSCQILTVLEGACEVEAQGHDAVTISRGETLVIPACAPVYMLRGAGVIVRSYVPRSDDAALAAWRDAQASGY